MTITVTSTRPHAAGSINENDVARAICAALGRSNGVTVSPGHIHVLTDDGWVSRSTPPCANEFLTRQMRGQRPADIAFHLDLRPINVTRDQHERSLAVRHYLRVAGIIGTLIAGLASIS